MCDVPINFNIFFIFLDKPLNMLLSSLLYQRQDMALIKVSNSKLFLNFFLKKLNSGIVKK